MIDHLNQKNSGPDKLTLQRKTRSTLNIHRWKKQIGTNRIPQETHLCETRSAEAERLAAEDKQREAEEQAVVRQKNRPNVRRKKAEREAAEQAKREAAEQAKREAAEKDKVSNQQDDMTKNAGLKKPAVSRKLQSSSVKPKKKRVVNSKKKHVALLKKASYGGRKQMD